MLSHATSRAISILYSPSWYIELKPSMTRKSSQSAFNQNNYSDSISIVLLTHLVKKCDSEDLTVLVFLPFCRINL
jgi:hypothetical protein